MADSHRHVPPSTSSKSSSDSSDSHVLLPSVSNVRNSNHPERHQEGSISSDALVINPVNLAQNLNLFMRPPLIQPALTWNSYSSNLVYQNFSHAVFHPVVVNNHLSQSCFHRPDRFNQQRHQSGIKGQQKDLRFWERISNASATPGFNFSIMSYNVLAQDLLDEHPHLYMYHDREFLSWEVRWKNLLAEIKRFHPDILCLQEVQGSHLNEYFSHLAPMGYLRLFKQRTGIRTDGCAIFYKHKVVNLIEHTSVEFKQPQVSILDRDNVAIIAKFAPGNYPKKEFVVATTHLLYNPRRQDVRLAQTLVLFTEIDRFAYKKWGKYYPVIVTGDLNSTPDSAVYKFITRGRLKYENLTARSLQQDIYGPKTGKQFLPSFLRITDQCQHADLLPSRQQNKTLTRSKELHLIQLKHSERPHSKPESDTDEQDPNLFSSGTLSHNFRLKSVHDHTVGTDFEVTTHQDEWVSVDYIFFSTNKKKADDLLLMERYKLPTSQQLGNLTIPNKNFGSDHLPLIAKFRLRV